MLATVALTLATHNRAVGVAVGVLLSGVFFMAKVSQLLQVRCEDDDAQGLRTWTITGQVFFASADALVDAFDVRGAEGRAVRIEASGAHFWDITGVAALEKVVQRLRAHGCAVEVVGMSAGSQQLQARIK